MSLRLPRLLLVNSSRSFSTSVVIAAPPLVKKSGKPAVTQGNASKSIFSRKKVVEGEDAVVVASGNVLAEVTLPLLDLSDVPVFDPEVLTPDKVGEVMLYSSAALASFKSLTIPGLIQKEFSYTKQPSTVIRQSTLDLANLLDRKKAISSKESRHVLVGAAGSGKSVLLLQTISYAQSTGWIVFYLPSATPLINSSTPHLYSSTQAIFHQPTLTATLLQRFASSNSITLKALKTSKDWQVAGMKKGENVFDFAMRGARDENVAVAVMEAVFEELSSQTKYPVLLSIDAAQSLFTTSKYIDPTYTPLESYSLSLPRLLLEFIAGTKHFARGLILLADDKLSREPSASFTHFLESLPCASGVASVRKTKQSVYITEKTGGGELEVYRGILQGLEPIHVANKLARKEAMGVVKMLELRRGVRDVVSDQTFLERYVAADGNPREFISRGLSRTFTD